MDEKEIHIDDIPTKNEPPLNNVVNRLVPPHNKLSRVVTNEDIDRVIEDSQILYLLCFQPTGNYKGAYATHHSQIDDIDPLDFFVTADKKIIMNPIITNHTKTPVDSLEACMTFPMEEQIVVSRFHKIEVEYVTVMVKPLEKDKFQLSSLIQEKVQGFKAFVFQHEVDHGKGIYIYKF